MVAHKQASEFANKAKRPLSINQNADTFPTYNGRGDA